MSWWAMGASVLLLLLSAIAYPGGTAFDTHTHGYSFFQNFISDLGMTVTHGGQSNHLGAGLFASGFALLSLSVACCVVGFIQLHRSSAAARPIAGMGAVGGVIAAACLLGAAVAPENVFPLFHMRAATVASAVAPPALVLFAVAAAKDGRFPPSVTAMWMVLALTIAGWFAMRWGPPLTTPTDLTLRASLQKIVAFIVVGTVIYQAHRGGRVAATLACDKAEQAISIR